MRLTRIKHDFQTQPCSGITGGGAGFIGFRDWDLGLFGLGCFMRWVIGLHGDCRLDCSTSRCTRGIGVVLGFGLGCSTSRFRGEGLGSGAIYALHG